MACDGGKAAEKKEGMLQFLDQQDPLPTAFITVRHRQQEAEEGYERDEKSLGSGTKNEEVVMGQDL